MVMADASRPKLRLTTVKGSRPTVPMKPGRLIAFVGFRTPPAAAALGP